MRLIELKRIIAKLKLQGVDITSTKMVDVIWEDQ